MGKLFESVVVQGGKDGQARRLPVAYLTLPPQFKVAIPNKLLRTGRRRRKSATRRKALASKQTHERLGGGQNRENSHTNQTKPNKHHTYDVYVCACFLAHAHAHRRKEIQELGFFFLLNPIKNRYSPCPMHEHISYLFCCCVKPPFPL